MIKQMEKIDYDELVNTLARLKTCDTNAYFLSCLTIDMLNLCIKMGDEFSTEDIEDMQFFRRHLRSINNKLFEEAEISMGKLYGELEPKNIFKDILLTE